MTTTTTNVAQAVLNIMTRAQYESITPSATELYAITDNGAGVDQTYNASSANAQSGVAIAGAGFLQNAATGTESLAIKGEATANYAIQIGYGTNSTASTLNIGFNAAQAADRKNWELLDGATGLIPSGRLAVFTGADGSNAGTAGAVPAPAATDNGKYLRGDCAWGAVADIDTVNEKVITQGISALSSGTISLGYENSIYSITPSGTTSFTFSTTNLNLSSSIAYTFELCVNMTTVYTLSFPNSVVWQDGVAPDLSTTGTYLLVFRTMDGGSTWMGNLQGVW